MPYSLFITQTNEFGLLEKRSVLLFIVEIMQFSYKAHAGKKRNNNMKNRRVKKARTEKHNNE